MSLTTVTVKYKNSVQYMPPDGFYCIQVVQNSILAGVLPGPHWGVYNAPLDSLVSWGRGYLLPILHPLDTFSI